MFEIIIEGRKYYINLSKLTFMELKSGDRNYKLTLDFKKGHKISFMSTNQYELEDIINGKLSGRTIALGDTISVLIQLANETLTKLNKGKHSLVIESEMVSNLAIPFELDDNNINIKFDPSNA